MPEPDLAAASDLDTPAQQIRRLDQRAENLRRVNPAEALILADRAVALSASADALHTGIALRARAHALRWLTRYTEAVAAFEAAVERFQEAGEEHEVAQTLVGEIGALIYLADFPRALEAARRARAVFERSGDVRAMAKLDLNTGIIHFQMDQPDLALQRFRRARREFLALDDQLNAAACETNVGHALAELDRFDGALVSLGRARRRYVRLGMPLMVATLDLNRGYVWSCRGVHLKALDHLLGARRVFQEQGARADVAATDLDVAQSYLALHMLPEAIEACHEAAGLFEAENMNPEQAMAMIYEADALREVRPEEARRLLASARRIFESASNRVWTAMADLRLAEVAPDPAAALASAAAAATLFADLGLERRAAEARLVMGRAHEQLDNLQEAHALYLAAGEVADRLGLTELGFRALQARARLEGSLPLYRRAAERLEDLRRSLGAEALKVAFQAAAGRIYEEMAGLLLAGARDPSELFFVAEAARARALADDVVKPRGRGVWSVGPRSKARTHGRSLRPPPATEHLRDRCRALQQRLREAELEARSEDVARLQVEAGQAERELLAHLHEEAIFTAARAGRSGAGIARLEDVQGRLEADQMLVEYFVVNGSVLALAVRADRVDVHPDLCALEEVTSLMAKVRFQFNTCERRGEGWVRERQAALVQATQEYLEELHSRLMAPLTLDGARRLVLVPYGPLHEVPFHALHDGAAYLVDRCEVVYTPSATVWQAAGTRRAPPDTGPRSPFVLGAADEYAPLVEQEAREIAHLLRVRPYVGARATRSAFLRHAPAARIIHLAAHATVRADNPQFSAVHFSDGPLAVHDLGATRLRAELAVLSACATGVGITRGGDEILSLARAFLAAGVRNLVVSQWPVWDSSTRILMQRFYAHLESGSPPPRALREAQIDLRARYAHPYYWAPFVTFVG